MAIHPSHATESFVGEPVRWATLRSGVALLGRILISVIFLASGFNKFAHLGMTAGYMTDAGIPSASLLAIVAGVGEIIGGLMVLFGWFTRLGALGLFLYLIPTTLIFHAFWKVPADAQQMQMVNFMKNVAIEGGLLQVVAFGAGGWSLDARRRRMRMARAGAVREPRGERFEGEAPRARTS
jgi:putative oxidoreductase